MRQLQSGATLLELIITVSLITGISGIIGYISLYIHTCIVYAQVHTIAMMCQFAQQRAIASLAPCVVYFDKEEGTYECEGHKEWLVGGVSFDVPTNVYGPPTNPVRVIRKAISFIGEKMVCYPTGIMQAGTVYLTDGYKRTVYALSNGVSAVSQVRIYKNNGIKWERI